MYKYQNERENVFTEKGQVMFLKIRDNTLKCLSVSGAISLGKAISCGIGGQSFTMIACVDRLVELGEIREVKQGVRVSGQNRIFVKEQP